MELFTSHAVEPATPAGRHHMAPGLLPMPVVWKRLIYKSSKRTSGGKLIRKSNRK
jgi:hypothetical protein